jgi:serine/threonine-protein kinase HipA
MNKIPQRYIEVHAHWIGLAKPMLMGILYATLVRNKEIFSFEYHHDWLKNNHGYILDPSL